MKKPTVKSVQKELTEFREKTKALIYSLAYPKVRTIATVPILNKERQLNGMTIAELRAIVNMAATTNERIYLLAEEDCITLRAQVVHDPVSVSAL